jgi:hypothetical protein
MRRLFIFAAILAPTATGRRDAAASVERHNKAVQARYAGRLRLAPRQPSSSSPTPMCSAAHRMLNKANEHSRATTMVMTDAGDMAPAS